MSNWTTDNIPDQSGRVAIVTGANTGLGLETAKALAARGAHVVLAVRNLDKGFAAVKAITADNSAASVSLQHLDLGSLASIHECAAQLRNDYPLIDLLINNAGVMFPPKEPTIDGFELQFGTNHLGHFSLTGLLLNNIQAAPGARVVTVSSMAHRVRATIHFDDLQFERRYNRVEAYGQSKLANLMFTYELQRRFATAGADTIAVAAHPGSADTDLVRYMPRPLATWILPLITQPAAMGALPTLRAATDPDVRAGDYYGPRGIAQQRGYPKQVKSSAQSHDAAKQQRLWAVSEKLTGVTFPI